MGASPVRSSYLDGHTELFGWKFFGDQIHIYIEDDEAWHFEISFHKDWLNDLKSAVSKMTVSQYKNRR